MLIYQGLTMTNLQKISETFSMTMYSKYNFTSNHLIEDIFFFRFNIFYKNPFILFFNNKSSTIFISFFITFIVSRNFLRTIFIPEREKKKESSLKNVMQ